MRIRVQENGNTYEVSALTHGRAKRMIDLLRVPVTPPEPTDEGPRVVGTGVYLSGPIERSYEYGEKSRHADMPIVFGFVRNEVNHGEG